MKSVAVSILCIVVSGGLGALAGWSAGTWLDVGGVAAALVAVAIGLPVAVAIFAAIAPVMRALGWSK
jgi:hypothetical protein